jgi:hypothetical protein
LGGQLVNQQTGKKAKQSIDKHGGFLIIEADQDE